MIRGTTPDYVLTLDGVDLSDQTVYVTIAQGNKKLTLAGDRLSITATVDGSEIAFTLTQEDTLGLTVGGATVQVRFIDKNGHAEATDIASLIVRQVLLEDVIEYADDTD